MKYKVFYDRRPWRQRAGDPILGTTHVFVREVEADSLLQVVTQMQGEIWSPNGEARMLIEYLGLSHTSMNVGDIAVDENGIAHWCASEGWQVIEQDTSFKVLGENLSKHILVVSHEKPASGEYVLVTLDCAIVRVKRDEKEVVVTLSEPMSDAEVGSLRFRAEGLWAYNCELYG